MNMKIKIYHHDEIISPDYNEALDALPEGLLFDGSHHRLVWKGEAKDLNLSEAENDQLLLENLFSISGDGKMPGFLIERYRPLGYGDIVLLDKCAYVCRTKDWLAIEAFPTASPNASGELRLLEKLHETARLWQEREFAADDALENHEEGSPDWTIFHERQLIYRKCGEELTVTLLKHHGEMLNKSSIRLDKEGEEMAERLTMKTPDKNLP
jgi:hypothetical protein